ncbi:alpha/beta hydrolase [Amycolatopsis pigmentata]|uniref:Alpha/beta hydrolase n=1 Tax=Amycolatopsis pigmentata TaxID=450801 RepID=A0ABW5FXK2_9PSEU
MPKPRVVLLPGTGSDEIFIRSVFSGPLSGMGAEVITPPPPAESLLVSGYLRALDTLASAPREGAQEGPQDGALIVGGVSFGAHLAARWALANPHRCAGLILALPAWSGQPGEAPASRAARASADLVEAHGLEAALRLSADGVAPWLAAELTRSWRRHGDGLAASLKVAADSPAPELEALRRLEIPAGIAACVDDPVHPAGVAHAWAEALPRAAVVETTLAALGEDRESLGRAAVLAWLRAGGLPAGQGTAV